MQMIQHFLKQKWTFPGNSKTDISHLDTQVVHWCPASNQLGLVGCLQTTNHPQTLLQGSGKPFSQANILHNSTLGLIWHLNWHWLCYVVWGQRLCLAQWENMHSTIFCHKSFVGSIKCRTFFNSAHRGLTCPMYVLCMSYVEYVCSDGIAS